MLISGNTTTFNGAATGVTSTPTRETRTVIIPQSATPTNLSYNVPSGGYLKVEW
jgi:hypothetical protein